MDLTLPAIERVYLLVAPSLFDLSTLELLEMTVSHTPVMGKVHFHLELRVRLELPCQASPSGGT